MGASVAYFLARRGVAVTVIERSGVACAASGKSGGFLALDWCDGSPLGPLARASFALHAELARAVGTDYGYRRMDTFMLAARERESVSGRHRVPAPDWIDGAGVVTAELGSTETTAQVHPARFTAALIEAAPARVCIGVVSRRWCSATARPAVCAWTARRSRPTPWSWRWGRGRTGLGSGYRACAGSRATA
jgi:glycine/D-amino acid oxidase-like deaminating enzyme